MARKQQFFISGTNIRIHSKHAPDEYERLWRALHKLKAVSTRGNFGLMIGDVRSESAGGRGLAGYFYKFLQIDPEDPWFDIRKRKEADDRDVANVKIPENLKPNLKQVPYFLDLKRHRLFYVAQSTAGGVSTHQVERHLAQLLAHESVLQEFGEADITPITDPGALERVMRWPVLRRIELVIEKPNPNDYDDEREVFERMQRRGVKSERIIYAKAKSIQTIVPDEIMRRQIDLAAENGSVDITGVNEEGLSDEMQSRAHPMRRPTIFDPDRQLLIDALIEGSGQ